MTTSIASAADELRRPLGGEDPADDRRREEVAVAEAGAAERGRLQLRQPEPGLGGDEHALGASSCPENTR